MMVRVLIQRRFLATVAWGWPVCRSGRYWLAAVSYTHLDVYKRQVRSPCTPAIQTPLMKQGADCCSKWPRISILPWKISVSYTHLGASAVIYGGMAEKGIAFEGVAEALNVPMSDIRLFGKPEAFIKRRMGVAVANGVDTDEARARAQEAAGRVRPVKG